MHPIRRRFETVFEEEGIRIISDYAHHPTEIAATLAAGAAVAAVIVGVLIGGGSEGDDESVAAEVAEAGREQETGSHYEESRRTRVRSLDPIEHPAQIERNPL